MCFPTVVRERGARIRSIGAELSRRFRQKQQGSVRRGLTLENGTLVITDNFLKVRIPHGHARNERVWVRLQEDGCGVVVEQPLAQS